MNDSMKTIVHQFIVPLLSVIAAAGMARAEAPGKELALSVHLVDGSCVIGTPVAIKTLAVRTEIGTIRIPLDRIERVEVAEDGRQWVFELQNGDGLEGVPEFDRIELETLLGRVAVATKHIAEIGLGERGAIDTFSKRGVMLHYAFEGKGESIEDRSGEENHGVNHGATIVPNGVTGSALSLDGTSSHLELGSDSIAGLPAWENYTISVWFLNDGGGDESRGYGQKIIDKTVMYHDFYLCVRVTGALVFHTYEGSGAGLQDDDHDYRDGKWHHVVVTKKGSHGELWIDGRLKDSNDKLKTVHSNGPLLVGYSKSTDGFQQKHWSGLLDELMILNRPLAQRDIHKLYTSRNRENPNPPGERK